ncbi:MAG TPA: hypothetical protein GXX40_08635 [Firmicutes bacterium]|nr:hypothetical protein [Bacillota bacterium]
MSDLDLLVLFIDAVVTSGHKVVETLRIGSGGHKRILWLWEGAGENATVCEALLEDLVERTDSIEGGYPWAAASIKREWRKR